MKVLATVFAAATLASPALSQEPRSGGFLREETRQLMEQSLEDMSRMQRADDIAYFIVASERCDLGIPDDRLADYVVQSFPNDPTGGANAVSHAKAVQEYLWDDRSTVDEAIACVAANEAAKDSGLIERP